MIIIMGLPGAGKTTVINKFLEKNQDYQLLNYGTLMFEIAKQQYNISHRDEIRSLNPEIQKNIQKQASDKIAEISKQNKKVILDTHCSIKTKAGYLPGLPQKNLSSWQVDLLVLINAPIEQILNRRKKDETRIRDAQTFDEIKEHDDFNKYFLAVYSSISSAPCSVISNKDNELDKSVEQLESIIKNVV